MDIATFISDTQNKDLMGKEICKLIFQHFSIDKDIKDLKEYFLTSKKITQKDFDKVKFELNFKFKTGLTYPRNASEFVEEYFIHNNYYIDALGTVQIKEDNSKTITKEEKQLIDVRSGKLSAKDILARLNDIRIRYNLPVTKIDIEDSINLYINNNVKDKREEICVELIAHGHIASKKDKMSDKEWNEFLNYVFPDDTSPNEVKKAVICQWVHNVKSAAQNKMNHPHPLMIVLFGQQSAGKSRFLNWFLSPIKDIVKESNLGDVTDSKNTALREDNLVINIAEMAGATKADAELMKAIMDGGMQSGRQLYSHGTISSYNKAQLIGSSNKDITEVIKDTTGNRRFFQLLLGRNETYRIDYSKFDVMKIWNSVDTDDVMPFNTEIHTEVVKVQLTQRKLDVYEEWFITCMENKIYWSENEAATYEDMFNNFRNFVDRTTPSMKSFISLSSFKTRLKIITKTHNVTFNDKVKKIGGTTYRYRWFK